ncbi:MAG: hypothetical protein SF029_18190 [bacterium]|nr:hypothetical protein [bacterium]
MSDEVPTEIVAETDNYEAWVSEEEDEVIYHLELGSITLHFFREELLELQRLVNETVKNALSK